MAADPMNQESPLQTLAVRLFAILLIVAGVGSVVTMVYGLFDGPSRFNLGFIVIFIGKGLLSRKERWRFWAMGVAWIAVFTAVVGEILSLRSGTPGKAHIAGIRVDIDVPPYLGLCIVAGSFLFFAWQLWVLSRPEVKASFTPQGERNDWWMALAIASLFAWMPVVIQEAVIHRLVKSVDYHEVTVQAFDSSTGDHLSPGIGLPSVSFGQVFPKIGVTTASTGGQATDMKVHWIGFRPITITVGRDGYQKKEVVLDGKEHHATIKVQLDKTADKK